MRNVTYINITFEKEMIWIFLGNLHFSTKEDDVKKVFEKCGEILDVRLVRDSTTGIGKGFGYVNFATADAVELAMRLNKVHLVVYFTGLQADHLTVWSLDLYAGKVLSWTQMCRLKWSERL